MMTALRRCTRRRILGRVSFVRKTSLRGHHGFRKTATAVRHLAKAEFVGRHGPSLLVFWAGASKDNIEPRAQLAPKAPSVVCSRHCQPLKALQVSLVILSSKWLVTMLGCWTLTAGTACAITLLVQRQGSNACWYPPMTASRWEPSTLEWQKDT